MRTQLDRRVAVLIRDEIAACNDFVAVLRQEQSALASSDIDQLLPLAKTKTDLAAKLTGLDEQRLRAIAPVSGENHAEKMSTWLASAGDAAADWQSLLGLIATARDINTMNGKLISERMRHNQQALSILLAAGEAANLYGPDGQPRLGSSGRTLGSA